MHISDIFQKFGIKGYDDLKEAEKKIYMAWEQILPSVKETLSSNPQHATDTSRPSFRQVRVLGSTGTDGTFPAP